MAHATAPRLRTESENSFAVASVRSILARTGEHRLKARREITLDWR